MSGSSSISLEDADFWARVKVFNKDLIRQSLRFEEADGLKSEALLTVGKKLADAEEKIAELESQLGGVREKLSKAEVARDVAKENINRLGRDLATDILKQLQGAPGMPLRGYNRTNVLPRLEKHETDSTVLQDASEEPVLDRKRALSEAMQPIDAGREYSPRSTAAARGKRRN
ncbi:MULTISPECIES: hypothetical protein [Corynebacterium]|uniref:hypothetical protein n=1 Tax=Corynebacterium TaxID=1716 RepID=UPI0018658963|nr:MULTISPECIES: hypothetical protein [Corynebacterium]